MVYSPSGRIKRIAGGNLLPPGSCLVCGGSSSDLYADLDVHVEWFGSAYLCANCVRAASEVFEDLLPSQEEALREHISELQGVIYNLNFELEQKEKLNESYRAVFDNLRTSGVSVDIGSNTDGNELQTQPAPAIAVDSIGDGLADLVRNPEPSDGESTGESDSPEPDIDIEDALDRASAALADSAGDTSEPPPEPTAVGRSASRRLFGE